VSSRSSRSTRFAGPLFSRLPVVIAFEARAFLYSKALVAGQLIVEPLAYLAFLAAGLQGWNTQVEIGTDSISYLTFVFPGVLALQAVRSLGRMIARATVDRRWGLLALKLLFGTHPFAYVLGMVIIPMLAFAAQALVSAPFAILLGAQITASGLLGATLTGMLAVTFWSATALLVTTGISSYQQRDLIMALTLLPLTFAAPTFYPLASAPTYLQALSWINPLTYQVTAMRDALLGNPFSSATAITLLLSLFSVVLATFVVSRAELLPSEH
jgi:ABC-type multidrug transport system permease subunit